MGWGPPPGYFLAQVIEDVMVRGGLVDIRLHAFGLNAKAQLLAGLWWFLRSTSHLRITDWRGKYGQIFLGTKCLVMNNLAKMRRRKGLDTPVLAVFLKKIV
jgi:hypothetical protein